MILSDTDIKEYISSSKIIIHPFIDSNIEPASVDLTLGSTYLSPLAPKNKIQYINQPIEYNQFDTKQISIKPKSFILATTKEYIKINENLTGFIEGKSSIGRAGLFVQNAGWVDSGFEGNITLELYNANDFSLVLYENMKICQIVFAETKTSSSNTYNGKYQGQKNTTGSMSYKDFKRGI
ncbi:dCTP deaminase [Staphylococcus cohnii]|uniref:dCTP deaminase n=1 Tax=Staphylococcus ureilyticus TaxID=94138 RepID=UPI000D1CA85F|nr:dCTP deaminase [Staphylococcus ureilyticus]MBM9448500.1 dCTP deaminase [Staphylococcus ureilyticus]PTF41943.1 dCTP deaminase [Staphylococcus cohnii]PTF44972.1 dCTP deaminase [Staphylococcus cohnii]